MPTLRDLLKKKSPETQRSEQQPDSAISGTGVLIHPHEDRASLFRNGVKIETFDLINPQERSDPF